MSDERKHTPKPWIVDEVATPNGKSYFINHLYESADDGDGLTTRTDEIAEVVMDYHDPEIPLANARIMAAAPEMLDSLRQLVRSARNTNLVDAAAARDDWADDPHGALSAACLSRCGYDETAADELYELVSDHIDAEIEIE